MTRRGVATLALVLVVPIACDEQPPAAKPPLFLIDHVPGSYRVFTRGELSELQVANVQAASVTLGDETRRALTPALPSSMKFAAEVPGRPVFEFDVGVATGSRVTRGFPIVFSVLVHTDGGEEEAFRTEVRRADRNRWLRQRADLTTWAGKRVQITLAVTGPSGAIYSPRWLFLYPALVLVALGLGVGVWVLPGPRTVAAVTFDVHTLLYAAAAISIGYQSIAFGLFTKIFAIQEGLMPKDPRLDKLFRTITLEVGLAVGATLVLIGLAGTGWALSDWGARSFGDLQPTLTLRVIIPALLALTLGFQIVLTSFFLSVLGLGRHHGGI